MSTAEEKHLRVVLSHYYLEKALKEREWLTVHDEHRSRLEEPFDAGPKLAWLHLIDQKIKKIGMQRAELTERFDISGASAVTHWFTSGKISGNHFAKLVLQPEFRGCRPSVQEIRLHELREAITWTRTTIVEDKSCNSVLKWVELMFLCHVHKLDEPDIDKAFKECPNKLKKNHPKFNADELSTTMRQWGKAFRIYSLEKCGGF